MADTTTCSGSGPLAGLNCAGDRAYGGSGPIPVPELVGNVINVILGVSGLVLVGLFIYGGVLYLTAQGDPDRVKQAKKTMINAVIGVVIIVVAYAAATFVIQSLVGATTTSTAPRTASEQIRDEICAQTPDDPVCQVTPP